MSQQACQVAWPISGRVTISAPQKRSGGGFERTARTLVMACNLIRTIRREIRVEEEPGRVVAAPLPAPPSKAATTATAG